jgi:hypothetical protein
MIWRRPFPSAMDGDPFGMPVYKEGFFGLRGTDPVGVN